MPKTNPREEIASAGTQKADVHLVIRAHSSINRTRKPKGRDDFLRPPHRNSKGDGKGSNDGSAKGTPQFFWLKSVANRQPCTNFKKGSCQRRNSSNCWQFPERYNIQSSRWMQIRGHVCIHTAKLAA